MRTRVRFARVAVASSARTPYVLAAVQTCVPIPSHDTHGVMHDAHTRFCNVRSVCYHWWRVFPPPPLSGRPCLTKLLGDADADVKYFARVGLSRMDAST
jgi:hypothetical protein